MTLTSHHVTVGGPVHFTLNMPSAPSDLRIHSVSGWIVQKYTLTSHTNPSLTASPPPHRRQLFKLDHHTRVRRPGTPPSPTHISATPPNALTPTREARIARFASQMLRKAVAATNDSLGSRSALVAYSRALGSVAGGIAGWPR